MHPAEVSAAAVKSRRGQVISYAAQQEAETAAAALTEEELIQLTKDFVAAGFGSAKEGDNLDDDFIFRGPVVGPLPKDQYLKALGTFKVLEGFPDIVSTGFGYSVDPTDPYRVWFFTQTTGTHTGNFNFGGATIPPTGGKIRNGTEANSVIWTPDRKIRYISTGYCVDRINSNTPNGTMKVAVAGFLRAAGKGELFDIITSPVVQWLTTAASRLQGKPSPLVPFEELPGWWRELPDANLRDAENYTK